MIMMLMNGYDPYKNKQQQQPKWNKVLKQQYL